METLAQRSCNTIDHQHTEGRPCEVIIKPRQATRAFWTFDQ